MFRSTKNRQVNGTRLWESLVDMAAIGPGLRGGNNRQALTDADGEARRLFELWCEEAGMEVSVDRIGNMFACYPGQKPELAPVFVGSHLDTQPSGGKYDGVLGVLAGLEIVRSLRDLDLRPKRSIVVVNWTNEEGARFAPAMLGSGVFAGVLTEEEAYARKDRSGKTVKGELERIGFMGSEEVGKRPVFAYYELHIEQGPILEEEGIQIGVVTQGQGIKWLEVTLTGQESHSGTTPMGRRRNAGLGFAKLTELVERIAWQFAPTAVGTIGQVLFVPNSPNIIPGRVVCTVDFRHPLKEVLTAMAQSFLFEGQRVTRELGLEMSISELGNFDPVTFDEKCVERLRHAAESFGYRYRTLVSGAGHDAFWMARVAPTAMVMCPCVGGLSHNEEEEILEEWAHAGANVLFHAVLETAG